MDHLASSDTGSSALSTRASSSENLARSAGVDLACVARKLSRTAEVQEGREESPFPIRNRTARPSRKTALALALGVAAVLNFLWQRRVNRLSKSAKEFGYGRLLVLFYGLLKPIVSAMGYKSGKCELTIPEKVPKGQKMICMHPHGLYLAGMMINSVAGDFCNRRKGDPLDGMMIVGSDAVFDIPIANGLLLLNNFRRAKRSVIQAILASGKTVSLYPGGIHEQLRTDPSQERCFFPPKLGFIRDAMAHGVPLVPLYTFGENQLYDVPSWTRRFSERLKSVFGVGVPLGVGRFGLPGWPKNVPLQSTFGRPVDVGPKGQEVTDERVEEVFLRYCAELRHLFAEHKDAHLPRDVAARGLEIIWRGREDLTAQLSLLPSAEPEAQDPPPPGQMKIETRTEKSFQPSFSTSAPPASRPRPSIPTSRL